MEIKLNYETFTLGELSTYKSYNFECDGDNKKIILTDKNYEEEITDTRLLDTLRKEIGE